MRCSNITDRTVPLRGASCRPAQEPAKPTQPDARAAGPGVRLELSRSRRSSALKSARSPSSPPFAASSALRFTSADHAWATPPLGMPASRLGATTESGCVRRTLSPAGYPSQTELSPPQTRITHDSGGLRQSHWRLVWVISRSGLDRAIVSLSGSTPDLLLVTLRTRQHR